MDKMFEVDSIKPGKNSDDIQKQNRLLIFNMIKEADTISRVELSKKSGLNQATISNIINDFLAMNIIKETGLMNGANGRRVIGLQLNKDKFCVMAVRITRSYYSIGIFDIYGVCLEVEKTFDDIQSNPEETIKGIKSILHQFFIKAGSRTILGVGVVTASIFDKRNNSYITNTFWKAELTKEFDVPVFVEKDANMSALVTWNENQTFKVSKKGILLSIMVGYEVECGIIIDGKIIRGKEGVAGEIGHVSIDVNGPMCECGNRGCFEQYVSISAIKKKIKERISEFSDSIISADCNVRDIINAYMGGDPLAIAIYDDVAIYIGYFLVNLVNFFNPDMIIIGDELPNNKRFLDKVCEVVRKRISQKLFEDVEIQMSNVARQRDRDPSMKGVCLYVVESVLGTTDNRIHYSFQDARGG